jgi:hypothetical protein
LNVHGSATKAVWTRLCVPTSPVVEQLKNDLFAERVP